MKNWNWLKIRKKKKEEDPLAFPLDFKTTSKANPAGLWSTDVLDSKSMEDLFKYMDENKDKSFVAPKTFIIDSYSSMTGSVDYDAKAVAKSKKWNDAFTSSYWSTTMAPIIKSMSITGSVPLGSILFEDERPNPSITTMIRIPPSVKDLDLDDAATMAAFPHLGERTKGNVASCAFSVYIGNPNNVLRSFIWNVRNEKIYFKDNHDLVRGALEAMNARMTAESTPHEPMIKVVIGDESTTTFATYVLNFKGLYLTGNDEICVRFRYTDVSEKGQAMNILSKIGMNCIFYIMGAIETNDDQTEIEMMEIDHIAYISGRKLVEKIVKPIIP